MIQQEIQERNEQIALMLGWEQYEDSEERLFGFWRPNTILEKPWSRRVERLEFHSDWNWLIESIKYILTITSEDDEIETYNIIIDQIPDIEAFFIAVSDFAKVYNNEL